MIEQSRALVRLMYQPKKREKPLPSWNVKYFMAPVAWLSIILLYCACIGLPLYCYLYFDHFCWLCRFSYRGQFLFFIFPLNLFASQLLRAVSVLLVIIALNYLINEFQFVYASKLSCVADNHHSAVWSDLLSRFCALR